MWCWGNGSSTGRLGNGVALGTNFTSNVPIQAVGLTSIASLTIGATHSCALRNDATLLCWGGGSRGQTGDGSYSDHSTALQVLTSVTAATAANTFTCATKSDGSGQCWGDDKYGELGDSVQNPPGIRTVALTCP